MLEKFGIFCQWQLRFQNHNLNAGMRENECGSGSMRENECGSGSMKENYCRSGFEPLYNKDARCNSAGNVGVSYLFYWFTVFHNWFYSARFTLSEKLIDN